MAGGLDSHWRPSDSLWLFSLESETWRRLELSGGPLSARFCHTAHLLPDAVVALVGGVGGTGRGAAPGLGVALLRIEERAGRAVLLGDCPVDLVSDFGNATRFGLFGC